MNSKELQLLQQLRDNSREKLTVISKKTHIPISTLFDMLKSLQNTPITKNTVILDFTLLGYHTRAQIVLRVGYNVTENVKKRLEINSNVNNVFKINGGFIIETVHRTPRKLDCFLEKLRKDFDVEIEKIHYLVGDVKREGFMFV